MAEGARLESVYTATYRGFESPPHRHILRRARTQVRAFFSHVAPTGGGREPPTGVRQLATPVGQTASPRAGCPAGASEASQSPPRRHILRRARTQVRAFFRMWHRRHPRGRHQCLSRATRPYPPGSPLCAAPPGGPQKQQSPGSPGPCSQYDD